MYVKKAIEEHNQLYDILHYFTDGNCYEFTDILNVVIKDNKIKETLIDECIQLEQNLYNNIIDKKILTDLKTKELINTLLSGYSGENKIFMHPIPNLIFTRDIAVCIGNTILITWSSKDVRKRENVLAKYIFKYYKAFSEFRIYDFHTNHSNLSIEGGDILVFNKDIVFIN